MTPTTQYRFYVGTRASKLAQRRGVMIEMGDEEALYRFGGFTRFCAEGGWRVDDGRDEYEETVVWEIITSLPEQQVHEFAVVLRRLFAQDAILMTSTYLDSQEIIN